MWPTYQSSTMWWALLLAPVWMSTWMGSLWIIVIIMRHHHNYFNNNPHLSFVKTKSLLITGKRLKSKLPLTMSKCKSVELKAKISNRFLATSYLEFYRQRCVIRRTCGHFMYCHTMSAFRAVQFYNCTIKPVLLYGSTIW